MAIAEVGGKIGDMTILYEDWDDASPQRGNWDPAVEAQNADKAIADTSVVAYIGTYNSGAAKISMPKLNTAGIVMASDPDASFTQALGLDFAAGCVRGAPRSLRYALLAVDGVVKVLNVEDNPGACSVSAGEGLLDAM